MRVLLIQAPLGPGVYRHVFPYGLSCLATVLKAKHEVKIVDPNVALASWNIADEIDDYRPDVIGVSLRNIDTEREQKPLLFHLAFRCFVRTIRRHAPRLPIIAGGAGFSIMPEAIMERCPEIDFGVYLEAEESLPELLENLREPSRVKGVYFRREGGIRFSGARKPPDLSALPERDLALVDLAPYRAKLYSLGVQSKRGCVLDCSYCSYPKLNGRHLRLREPERVVDEIENLVLRHGVSTFSFLDNVFDLPREHGMRICESLVRRKVKVRWYAWFSGIGFDQELFSLALRAGCDFFSFSPDAYTPRTLEQLHKRITPEDIRKIIGLFRRYRGHVQVEFNFFGNSPGMRLADFARMIGLYLEMRISLRHCLRGIGMDYIRILPDTDIYKTALTQKVLAHNTELLPETAHEFRRLFYREPGAPMVDRLFQLFRFFHNRGIV